MVEMRNLFGTIARSTSAPAGYDQIDDTSEGRLKVHAEEAFKAGIKFKARFIGSLEIPKVFFDPFFRSDSSTRFFGRISRFDISIRTLNRILSRIRESKS